MRAGEPARASCMDRVRRELYQHVLWLAAGISRDTIAEKSFWDLFGHQGHPAVSSSLCVLFLYCLRRALCRTMPSVSGACGVQDKARHARPGAGG